MSFFRPGTIRAFSRGMAGRRGRSIRMNARIAAIIFIAIFISIVALMSLL